jgi:MFS family permease
MRGNLLTLIASWVFIYFSFSLVFPFESPYIRELGAPPFVIGLMGSIGAMALGLVRIPGAYIADRYGRKQIIVTMTFVIACSYLFYIFAPDWRFVLIGMIMSNLSLIYQPALQAILADSVPPEKRGMGYAATNVVPNMPTIIAPATAGFLVATYGLVPGMRIVYTLVFVCIMIAAIIRLLFLRETLRESRGMRLGEMKMAFKDSLGAIAEAWRDMSKSLKFLTVAFLISAFEEPVFRMFTSLYALDVIRVSEMEWGLVNTVWILVTLSLGFPLGKVIDKIGRKKSIMLAYLLFTPSSIFFIFCRSFPLLLTIFLMFALGGNLIMPAYNALQADMIPREKRGRIMGTIGTLNVLATVPASALSGFLYDSNPAYPFVFSVILGIVVALLILFTVKEPKEREI